MGDLLPFEQIAIIGAGQMGRGIARVCLEKGYRLCLIDHEQVNLDHTVERIRQKSTGAALENLVTGLDLSLIQDADLVIEAIPELESEKRNLFQALIPFLKQDALIATNSSSISITRLAASSDRPTRFCGMHFMHPVSVMPLVELVRGLATSDKSFDQCAEFVKSLGKEYAESQDFPGFIVNRVLAPMMNEAIYALYEGVGNVVTIDRALRLGASHPLGPLQLADFIGLDNILSILTTLHNDLADNKYRPCPLLQKYVEAGWIGVKVGRGFYDYASDPPKPTR
ncbi:MAG: 3-hydroxyacyl-CoA dehydrogenase NAD-binding domain-containing protein [Alphaproteobacteria bacterium]